MSDTALMYWYFGISTAIAVFWLGYYHWKGDLKDSDFYMVLFFCVAWPFILTIVGFLLCVCVFGYIINWLVKTIVNLLKGK